MTRRPGVFVFVSCSCDLVHELMRNEAAADGDEATSGDDRDEAVSGLCPAQGANHAVEARVAYSLMF